MRALFAMLLILAASHAAAEVTVRYPDRDSAFGEEIKVLIQTIADETASEVRALLPGLDEELVLQVMPGTQVIEETGELGGAIAPGTVRWTVDDSRPEGVAAVVRTSLRTTLFHEFHHLVRGWTMEGGAPVTSLMDAVVAEGLATAFAGNFAGFEAPWGSYPDDVADWVEELERASLNQYGQWMFQHPDGRRWIGYRAGTYLVERAREATGKTTIDLVTTPTREIIAMGASAD